MEYVHEVTGNTFFLPLTEPTEVTMLYGFIHASINIFCDRLVFRREISEVV